MGKTVRGKTRRVKSVRSKPRRTRKIKRRTRRSRGGGNKNGNETSTIKTNAPTSENATPTSGNATPTSENATPTSGNATPISGNANSKPVNATPTSGNATPTSGNATPTLGNATPAAGTTNQENVLNGSSLNKLFSKNGLGAPNVVSRLNGAEGEGKPTVNSVNAKGATEVVEGESKEEVVEGESKEEVVEGESKEEVAAPVGEEAVAEEAAKVEIEALENEKPEVVKEGKISLFQTMVQGYQLYKKGDMDGLMKLGIANLDKVFKNENLREKFKNYAKEGFDKLNDMEFDEITSKLEEVGVPILSQLKMRLAIAPRANTQGSEVSGNTVSVPPVNTVLAAPELRKEVAISPNNSAKDAINARNAQTQANITKLAFTLKQAAINAQTMSNHLKRGGGKIKSRRKRGGCLNGTCKY